MSKHSQASLKHFQEIVLTYYKKHGRSLPWRETQDPYRIFISEMMLQQTQVDRVIEKYLAFLKRFPTPQSLRDAPLADVLRMWQGLGYNRRAKYVHAAAQLFAQTQQPTREQLLALKGVGPYTAAAVCAFAYNQDIAAIDVNIRRVFTRYFGEVDDDFIAQAVPNKQSRDWHNALMDFGATLCTKKSPSCHNCALKHDCVALNNDLFAQEKTKSQKKFEGSIRWHRGQILKATLKNPTPLENIWVTLDEKHRDRERFEAAASQLAQEQLIHIKNSMAHPPAS